jgi:hypothetical protein
LEAEEMDLQSLKERSTVLWYCDYLTAGNSSSSTETANPTCSDNSLADSEEAEMNNENANEYDIEAG